MDLKAFVNGPILKLIALVLSLFSVLIIVLIQQHNNNDDEENINIKNDILHIFFTESKQRLERGSATTTGLGRKCLTKGRYCLKAYLLKGLLQKG